MFCWVSRRRSCSLACSSRLRWSTSVSAVTRPISAGVTVLLYLDMRMRKEGLDLALQNAAGGQQMSGNEFETVWRPPAGRQGPAAGPGPAPVPPAW